MSFNAVCWKKLIIQEKLFREVILYKDWTQYYGVLTLVSRVEEIYYFDEWLVQFFNYS